MHLIPPSAFRSRVKKNREALAARAAFRSHAAGHVFLNMSPKLTAMSMMDVPLQAVLQHTYTHTYTQTRVSAFIWNRRHLRETDSLTTALVAEDTFKRSKLFSCRGADVRGCVEGRIYVAFFFFFTGTSEKKKKRRSTREHFRYSPSLVSLWPRSLRSFRRSGQYLFYFSCVYNVIWAEDLTRSLSFADSAGEPLRNVPLKESTSSIFTPIYGSSG